MSAGSVAASDSRPVVGLVLAGGRSVRFGGEKAVALLEGRPLLEWAAVRLRTVCASVAVNVRKQSEAEAVAKALGLPTLYDTPGDALGPLAGVKVGLIWAEEAGARTLAVSPCDAPLLPNDLYVRLLERALDGAAMAETRDGRQPLCALWPVTSLPVVRDALAGGAHPPTWQLLERLGARKVFFDHPEAFANVNTRDDLIAVIRALEAAHRPTESGIDAPDR
jgi:molybdopterin-guanine dinucleotide biosynthesis protein A